MWGALKGSTLSEHQQDCSRGRLGALKATTTTTKIATTTATATTTTQPCLRTMSAVCRRKVSLLVAPILIVTQLIRLTAETFKYIYCAWIFLLTLILRLNVSVHENATMLYNISPSQVIFWELILFNEKFNPGTAAVSILNINHMNIIRLSDDSKYIHRHSDNLYTTHISTG